MTDHSAALANPAGSPAAPANPTDTPANPTGSPAAPANPTDTPANPTDTPAAPANPTDTPAAPANPTDTPARSTDTPARSTGSPAAQTDAIAPPAQPLADPTEPAGHDAALIAYPIALNLAGRRAVVVGGGSVALRRVRSLLAAGALVHVIAPLVDGELARLGVIVHRRRYRDGDLADAWLVHAATDDAQVNTAVTAEAERRRVWCVRADDARASSAWAPAVARHGDVSVAVTAGGDPRRAQRLRAAISLALAEGSLPLRRQRRPEVGCVALVGGGPGDAGLITVRGRRLLAEADVVVADKLAPRDLLADIDPDVEVIDAGKAPHAHNLTQEQINALIVSRALAGKRVVRLKGGDPFVFGRGGEEALACVRAGIPFTVVPGVTSAVAVPAYAGIPVTHRGITQDFAVVSAHLDPSHPGATVDWAALAHGPGTLVLLMAVAHLEQITDELVKRGRDASTPVAVICDGTTPRQQVLTSTLGQVAAEAARQGIQPPAVVVVGEVVRLRDLLGSPSSAPTLPGSS